MISETQSLLLAHAEAKALLLTIYLERYLSMISHTRFIVVVHYIDLFSGPGIYEDGGLGSPLIVLRKLRDRYFSARARGMDLTSTYHCFLNEKDEEKRKALERNITTSKLHYPEIGNIAYHSADYKVLYPLLLRRLAFLTRKERALIFIDPYGYRDIRFYELKNLLKGNKSEVLLFLPTQLMFRFSENGTPDSLHHFINDLVPKEAWPKGLTSLSFVEKLKVAFKHNLGGDFFVDFLVTSRVKDQYFCLFFFTSHIYGFDRMLDAKWEYQAQSVDLFSKEEQMANILKFERALEDFLARRRTNLDLYVFTLHNGHTPAHANQLLRRWQQEGLLEVTLAGGKPARKSSFYISWDYYKNKQGAKAYFDWAGTKTK